jgi:hypothetical protein
MTTLHLLPWLFRAAVVVGAIAPADFPQIDRVGRLEAKDIEESSGLVASRRFPDVLYTHNDSGGAPVLFAVRPDGNLLKQYRVPARHTDWEDVAIDDAARLYVADTGNNNVRRDHVVVYRLAEPNLDPKIVARKSKAKRNDSRRDEGRLRVEHTWRLTFPGGRPFNCESLFVHRGFGYMISKVETGPAALYRFPLDDRRDDVAIEKVTDLPTRRPASGADLSPDGKRLAVVTRGELCVFQVDGDPAAAGRLEPTRVPLPPQKIEAVAWTPDRGLLMTAETREVYHWKEGAAAD